MSSKACLLRGTVLLAAIASSAAAIADESWPAVNLASPRQVELAGPVGAEFQRGIERLARPPYTTQWLRADVSFELERVFTNYSGDVSGRFLELASLTSPAGKPSLPTLAPLIKTIARYQKADGHFGVSVDLAKPLPSGAPPIPVLWGNARLLVGLLTAAQEVHDGQLLAAAQRLGDFYVDTAGQLCSPAREAEYRASGSDGGSYTCCYFPAIEGLAMLYRATKDDRYLKQAERMAEFFTKFDRLPIDHSHGNLCAWRGILELYDVTGKRAYLDRAKAKWDAATKGGFVWPLGGVGEAWRIFFHHDEGCSESDWLRLNLDLWRFTGETRYLDLAERLLENQYSANQCANGGYGVAHFDGDSAGPIAVIGTNEECPYCCSFHGPLGLHFLKSYLAAGSDRGVFVNFSLDFASTVKSGNRDWRVTVRTRVAASSERDLDVELAPADGAETGTAPICRNGPKGASQKWGLSPPLWIRRPNWATGVKLTDAAGAAIPFSEEAGYLRIQRAFGSGERLHIAFQSAIRVEKRRFESASVAPGRISRLREVTLLDGPDVLFAAPASGTGRLTLLAQVDSSGHLGFWPAPQGGYLTVALPSLDADSNQIATALASAKPITLRPGTEFHTARRMTFVNDLIAVPAKTLGPSAGNGLAGRYKNQQR